MQPPASSTSFVKATYYVGLGQSTHPAPIFCVYIGTIAPAEILCPVHDRKYILHEMWTFTAPRKLPFAAIISNLRDSQIIPRDGFNPPVNPDNKFMTDLTIDRFADAHDVIEATIHGLTLGVFEFSMIDPEIIAEAEAKLDCERILLDSPAMIILGSGHTTAYTVHQFDNPTTTIISPVVPHRQNKRARAPILCDNAFAAAFG